MSAETAIASSEPILKKPAYLIAICKSNMTVVSRKHLKNTHRLGGSFHLTLLVSL